MTDPDIQDRPPQALDLVQPRLPKGTRLSSGPALVLKTKPMAPDIDEFEIIGSISEGGMSQVYRARQVRLAREVALKVLRVDLAEDPTYRRRFQAEAKAAARISHPGIVRVWAAGEWKERLWIAYELVEGQTLGDLLAREQVLDPPRACRILARVAEAVADAHRHGVIHRDLKPDNILLAGDDRPMVADFGLAKRLPMTNEQSVSGTPISRTGEVFGTPEYMAPEQVRGKVREHGPATDVWALGVILYRALSGSLPFDGENTMQVFNAIILQPPLPPSRHRPSLAPAFDKLFLYLFEKEPAARLDRADILAETLDRLGTVLAKGDPCDEALVPLETWVAGKGQAARPAAAQDIRKSRPRARRFAAILVTLGLAGLLAWAIWWLFGRA